MAVETIVPLLEMGVSGDEVLELIDAALNKVSYSGCLMNWRDGERGATVVLMPCMAVVG